MAMLLSLLITVCFIALLIGLIKPGLVIRWGDQSKKTRRSVLKYYGIGLLVFCFLSGIFADNTDIDAKKINTASETTQEETVVIDTSAAIQVDNQIAALGDFESLTLENSADVQSARESYDSLDPEQKSYITNIAILSSAEAKIVELQVKATEEAAAMEEAARVAAAAQEKAELEAAQVQAEPEVAQDQNIYTVYITETGSKYHREGCQYLRQSQIPITKSEAVSQGYTPCSKCNP